MAKVKNMVAGLAGADSKYVYYVGDDKLTKEECSATKRNSNAVIVLPHKDFISFNFELSKDLVGEDMDDSVEIKMYQDAGLNPLLEYKIVYSYVNSAVDPTVVNVQAFAVSHNTLKAQTDPYIKQYGYVDVAIPSETLPFALYSAEILEPKNDIFFYFEKDTLEVSMFSDGNFLYAKQIDFGLKKIVENFVSSTGEQIKYDDLISILVSKGFDKERYSDEEMRYYIDFNDLFANMSTSVASVIQYASRMFGIDSFERAFIGTKKGTIPNVSELCNNLLGIDGFDYIFYTDFFLQSDGYVDQRYVLALLELENSLAKRVENPLNVTFFKRPSSFFNRPGGRFLSVFTAGTLLLMAYPLFLYFNIQVNDYMTGKKLKELKFSKQEFIEFQNEEGAFLKRQKQLKTLLTNEKEKFAVKESLIREVYEKKSSKKAKIDFINALFLEVNTYKVKIDSFDLKKETVMVSLEAKNQNQITRLIKNLVSKKYKVEMKTLTYSNELKRYTATLKVFVK